MIQELVMFLTPKDNKRFIPLDTQYAACNWPYHLKAQFPGQSSPQISELSSPYTVQNRSSWCRIGIPHHRLFPSSPGQYTSSLLFLLSSKPYDHLIITCTNLYFNYLHQYLKNV